MRLSELNKLWLEHCINAGFLLAARDTNEPFPNDQDIPDVSIEQLEAVIAGLQGKQGRVVVSWIIYDGTNVGFPWYELPSETLN